MKLFSAALIFIIAFVVGAAVILTFTQDQFKVPVAAKLLFYSPPAIPVYWYVMGCFGLGLLLGLLASASVWISSLSKSFELRQTIRRLEDELLQARIAQSGDMAAAPNGNQAMSPQQ